MCAAKCNRSGKSAARTFSGVSHALEPLESRLLFAVGDIDPTFAGGSITQDFLHRNDFALAVAVQSDNKVLLAGWISTGTSAGNDFALARLNYDGSLDSTFGGTGMVVTDIGSASDSAFSLALQSDGRIVVVGQTNGATTSFDFAMARYNADGSLDSSFGTGGKVITDFSQGSDHATAVKVMSDGRIVVGGWTTVGGVPQFASARYTTAGLLDGTFGTGGRSVLPFANGSSQANSVALLADGSYIMAGTLTDYSSSGSDYAAVHILSSGQLDTSFGNAGWAQIDLGGDFEVAYSVAVQSDGKILLAGESQNSTKEQDDFGLVRLTTSGQLDASFGSSGYVFTDFAGEHDQAASMVVQASGKIVVAGTATVAGQSRFAVARYNADGSLDGSFAGGTVTFAFAIDAFVGGMAVDSQGRIVVGGYTFTSQDFYDFAAARFIGGKVNAAPAANPGGPYSVNSGLSIQLDGAGSFDSDGSIVSYEWDFNYDGSIFDSDATGGTPNFSAAGLTGPIVRAIALRVTDDGGATSIATTTITINPTSSPAKGTTTLSDDPDSPGKKILTLWGTDGDDVIRFKHTMKGATVVRLNGKLLGNFSNVSRIVAYGYDGNDVIDAHEACVPVGLFGGNGNDRLIGSRFNDILVGGAGNDRLYGGRGDDLIIGGTGKDELHSRFGNDILVGGSLSFESDLAALSAVLAEWTRTDVSRANRIAHLQTGGGLNGLKLLDSSTVIDDHDRDNLHGTPDADWIISGAGDKIDKLKNQRDAIAGEPR